MKLSDKVQKKLCKALEPVINNYLIASLAVTNKLLQEHDVDAIDFESYSLMVRDFLQDMMSNN